MISPQEMDIAFVMACHRDLGDPEKMELWKQSLASDNDRVCVLFQRFVSQVLPLYELRVHPQRLCI